MRLRFACIALTLVGRTSAIAQPAMPTPPARDFTIVDTIAPGVIHTRLLRAAGPWEIHVVAVDLRDPALAIETAHALGTLGGRERPTTIARTLDARWCSAGKRVLAAVNGDLFELATGENEGNQIVGGVLWKAGRVTDSPFDSVDNAHTQFAIDARGRPLLERFAFDGVLRTGTRIERLDGVNARRGGAAVLYTSTIGARTPNDSARRPVREAAYALVRRNGDTLVLRRAGAAHAGGGTAIARGGYVLSIADSARARSLLASSTVTAVLRFAPDRGTLRTLLGGWGRLVDDGQLVALRADTLESLLDSFAHRRHGRTAIGFSRDSATVYLITVDGRRSTSVGMTLAELAQTARDLGAWNATNLDGGGSTSMNVLGRLVNVPSDSAGERTVGNVVLVTRRGGRCG